MLLENKYAELLNQQKTNIAFVKKSPGKNRILPSWMLSASRKKDTDDKISNTTVYNITPSLKNSCVKIVRCTNFLCNIPSCKDHAKEDFSTKKKKENFLKNWNWAIANSLKDFEASDSQTQAENHNVSKSTGPNVTNQGTSYRAYRFHCPRLIFWILSSA